MESYRLNDLDITLDRNGADRYTKASYPVRYGRFCEIKSSDYLFQFNLSGEIKYIQGLNQNWPHPAEWLKRTDANDWVYYSIAGYHQIFDSLGEYYLPCLPYPTNSIWAYNPFAESMIQNALRAWTQLPVSLCKSENNGLPFRVDNFLDLVINHDAGVLYQKSLKLHEIIGGRVSVLPPDTRHVDYEVIPLMIADGCLYHCGFCCIKSRHHYRTRSEHDIMMQIHELRDFYGANLRNYNALYLGNHDALGAGEKLICLAAEAAYKTFGFATAHIKNPSLFLFGSVDSLLNAEISLFENLNRTPFRTYINVGLESADPATLAEINKPLEVYKIEDAFQKILEVNRNYLNIEITANFLIGDRLTAGHYRTLIDMVRCRLDRFYSKGGIYLSPLFSNRNDRDLLRTFFKVKNLSRLPVYLYLIQRL
jgi:hypothetical protein